MSLPMRPLAFSERGVAEPCVSLRELLAGGRPTITGTSAVDLPGYTDEILRSGFPGVRDLPERARQVQLDSYLTRIVEREVPESGVSVRRPAALRAWLAAYAAATATDAAHATILAAATPGEGYKPARQTADIDLVVEAPDRSTVAIEVKLTDTIRPGDVEHLNWLHRQIGDRLVDRMVLYSGKLAYRRPDGVAVVPLALLGP